MATLRAVDRAEREPGTKIVRPCSARMFDQEDIYGAPAAYAAMARAIAQPLHN